MAYKTRLKDLREDSDMTQKQLAQLLKTTQPQIVRYEQGTRDLPLEHLVLICHYFNISADFVLGLPDNLPHTHSKTKGRKSNES